MTDIFDQAAELEQRQREEALARHHQRRRSQAAGDGGAAECRRCGIEIPKKRRQAVPGCTRCIECERIAEARNRFHQR